MKKILIQYLYIFIITLIMLLVFTTLNACEVEEIKKDETLPICEEYQVSTEEKPCKKGGESISVIGEAIKKLGESGTLPK